ncbi:MAG: matrixin family metalloprotease [bacterium]
MKTKIISLILSIFLLFETMPVIAVVHQVRNSPAQFVETAHKAYNRNDFLKAGQYYEKAYSVEKNQVFIDNAITAYSSYAFNLANEKKYDEAIKYCQKVLSLRQSEQNTKELLSDIYYSRSSYNFYNGNPQKAKEDLENSLKYSMLPEQAQKAREGLSQLKETGGDLEFKPITTSAPDSMPELVKLVEMKIYGKSHDNLPVLERIAKLEKDIFNKNYNDESLTVRLDRLKKAALPELAQKPANNFGEEQDYIQDIIEQSSGTAKIFGKMPIIVYIDDADVKNYKKYYRDAVKDAMKEWENASGGKIKFETSNDPKNANLKIVWTEYFEDFAWQPELKKEDVSAEKQKLKYKKASSIVQIGSIAAMVLGGLVGVPVIGLVGSVGGSVASPLLQYKGLNLDDRIMKVKINTDCTSGMTKEQSFEKIKQIAMHQLGHSIGIYGHSPDSNDIMYGNFNVNKLSDRDKNTIKEIYKNVKTNSK